MSKKISKTELPSEQMTEKHEMLIKLIDSMHLELKGFAQKKPDGVLNKTKIGMVNRLLKDIKELLVDDESLAYLDILDEDSLPENSDAVLITGQYKAAMVQFKNKYFGFDGTTNRWFTKENPDRRIFAK